MTGLEIIAAIGAISAYIAVLQNEGHKNDEKEKNALLALNKAVLRTEGYLSRKAMNESSSDAKHELTELWNEASIECANAGFEKMQKLCQIKGVYWLNPSKWTDQDIKASGIQLAEMKMKLDVVLCN
ncbi:hypothetical protein EU510_08945 [Pseudoalteromonas sp. FUC4]|uniref:hypothetical protein n=1 Tax=Pseudoalteromonas sp. FUC4 TaxID=2511201 RepID=UPI0011F34E9D|nr:hypothetical protein [Pseudoalteromonas sp. FUC4]KAA1153905.1 hypothetical protein EU510_08945 [Pseudoalteromonas sp. FUC4]